MTGQRSYITTVGVAMMLLLLFTMQPNEVTRLLDNESDEDPHQKIGLLLQSLQAGPVPPPGNTCTGIRRHRVLGIGTLQGELWLLQMLTWVIKFSLGLPLNVCGEEKEQLDGAAHIYSHDHRNKRKHSQSRHSFICFKRFIHVCELVYAVGQ